jgi:hypothetical protein
MARRTSRIDYSGDVDRFRFRVRAGRTYAVYVAGRSLRDPTLTVYSPAGFRSFSDDAVGLNPLVRFTAFTSGFANAYVRGYRSSTGSYTIATPTRASLVY